jgi:hypothetical protein
MSYDIFFAMISLMNPPTLLHYKAEDLFYIRYLPCTYVLTMTWSCATPILLVFTDTVTLMDHKKMIQETQICAERPSFSSIIMVFMTYIKRTCTRK